MGKLRHLRRLQLPRKITSDALAAIEGLVELEYFWLPEQITDAGLHHLRNMTKMRRLQCSMRAVTDDGLRSIRALTHLRELNLELAG